jgi:hypothetical protein
LLPALPNFDFPFHKQESAEALISSALEHLSTSDEFHSETWAAGNSGCGCAAIREILN